MQNVKSLYNIDSNTILVFGCAINRKGAISNFNSARGQKEKKNQLPWGRCSPHFDHFEKSHLHNKWEGLRGRRNKQLGCKIRRDWWRRWCNWQETIHFTIDSIDNDPKQDSKRCKKLSTQPILKAHIHTKTTRLTNHIHIGQCQTKAISEQTTCNHCSCQKGCAGGKINYKLTCISAPPIHCHTWFFVFHYYPFQDSISPELRSKQPGINWPRQIERNGEWSRSAQLLHIHLVHIWCLSNNFSICYHSLHFYPPITLDLTF